MKNIPKKLLSTLLMLAMLFSLSATMALAATAQEGPVDTLLGQYINEKYPGKITVTIAAQRPVENSRVVVNVSNYDSGHTFIRLDFDDGTVIARGFSPIDDVTIPQIVDNTSIKGKLIDNAGSEWNAAVVYEITIAQAEIIQNYITNFDVDDFRAVSNNCTTFAANALVAAGITPPTQKHKWTLPARSEIIAALPFYIPFKGIFADQLLSKTYYGYSPADAVQDFKSNANCILKYDGAIHKP